MPFSVNSQRLDIVNSKRPKSEDTPKSEDLIYTPESPGRRHSHITLPVRRRLALPGSAIDAFTTDDDYQYLRTECGFSEDSLKNAWEMCRRLDPFDVFDSYSDDDLCNVLRTIQCKAARQLFRKIHQAASVGHDQEEATNRDSAFYSSASSRSSRTTLTSSYLSTPTSTNSLAESQGIGIPLSNGAWSEAAAYSSRSPFSPSYGSSRSIEAYACSEEDAATVDCPLQQTSHCPIYSPSRPAAFPANLPHSRAMAPRMMTIANFNHRIGATAPTALPAVSVSDSIHASRDGLPQTRQNTTISNESSGYVQRSLHECTHCAESFERAGDRNRHHEKKHDALYTYKCKQCPSNSKDYDSFTSIRRHLSQVHNDQSSADYHYPERCRYRPPNIAMACGLCGELLRRGDWTMKVTSGDKRRRHARRPGAPRDLKAVEFERDKQEDELNQAFLESIWYHHISTKHHSDLSGWSRRIVVDAFFRQEELRLLLEFAVLNAPISLQWMTKEKRRDHWNAVLNQRLENNVLWDKILEQLEFRSLSGDEGDAKRTIELCIGLDRLDWTPFDWSSGPRTPAWNSREPEIGMRSSRSTTAIQTNSPNSLESSLSVISELSLMDWELPFLSDTGEVDFGAWLMGQSVS